MPAPLLALEQLRHDILPGLRLFEGLSLRIMPGEWLALIGGPGAGKSTLLRLIAERLPAARLLAAPRPSLPWQGCAQRLAQPLRAGGLARAEAEARIAGILARLGLAHRAQHLPSALSEAEAARLALAAAMLAPPALLLVDGLPDADFAATLAAWAAESGTAILCATRDAAPALAHADRAALLAGGRILQEAAPQRLYEAPESALAARLMGPCNLLPARTLGVDEEGLTELRLDAGPRLLSSDRWPPGERALAAIRPARIVVAPGRAADFGEGFLPARLLARRAEGERWCLTLALADGTTLLAHRPLGGPALPGPGAPAALAIGPTDIRLVPAGAMD